MNHTTEASGARRSGLTGCCELGAAHHSFSNVVRVRVVYAVLYACKQRCFVNMHVNFALKILQRRIIEERNKIAQEFAETKQQMEDDVDREIDELKASARERSRAHCHHAHIAARRALCCGRHNTMLSCARKAKRPCC